MTQKSTTEQMDLDQLLESRHKGVKAPSSWQIFKAKAVKLLSTLLPWLTIPGYCVSCWAKLELVDDQLLTDDNIGFIHGVRFWKCSHCGSGASTKYIYHRNIGDIDPFR